MRHLHLFRSDWDYHTGILPLLHLDWRYFLSPDASLLVACESEDARRMGFGFDQHVSGWDALRI
jgi:hypothetical protein